MRRLAAGRCVALAAVWAAMGAGGVCRGQDAAVSEVHEVSDEGQRAMARFELAPGLQARLFAAEPLLANPVAFAIDGRNRLYVAETFRLGHGVTDNRGHMGWLDDDLAARTVADRVAMYRKHLSPEEFLGFGPAEDRVRRLVDQDGDGAADAATIFADGFRGPESGIGSGLLARGQTVWYTNIPSLWKLTDADDDGIAESRAALSTGYGVKVAFIGHDLHGLIRGPDGRLYFSIGDRGLNVTTPDGRTVVNLDSGAVLRCELDGTGLELFASGLRNPQELAFDERGDLISVDNNSDSGDRARLVHLVPGGDNGWRMGYQYIEEPTSRGPWNAEKLWHPAPENTAAYLIPPVANLADGPSGLVYNPGVTRLPAGLKGWFLLADFRGSPDTSGIRAFRLEPQGAGHRLAADERPIWKVLATDVDFGADGVLYVSDWVEGWELPGKGRIYAFADPARAHDPALAEVQRLLGEGMTERHLAELVALLDHEDQRIRLEAQWELAERAGSELAAGSDGARPQAYVAAQDVARDGRSTRARRHAVWVLRQLARRHALAVAELDRLLADGDAEIRAQAALALSESATGAAEPERQRERADRLAALLRDAEPRVRFAAALALARHGRIGSLDAVLGLLRENADADPLLRHAGVMALASIADASTLAAISQDATPAARLGAVLALRRQGSPEVARFLADADERVVLEAARAIADVPLAAAQAELAALAARPDLSEPVLRRVVSAALRVGTPEAARGLAALAAADDAAEPVRRDALEALSQWGQPSGRDRVTGLWRPIEPRPAAAAVAALGPVLPRLLAGAPGSVRRAASQAASALGIQDVAPTLAAMVKDQGTETSTRLEALRGLVALRPDGVVDTLRGLADDPEPALSAEALDGLATLVPAEAVERLPAALESDDLRTQQRALALLGRPELTGADALLLGWVQRLEAGAVPPALRLDVTEAARRREEPAIRAALTRYLEPRASDPLAAHADTLEGGDPVAGALVFQRKAEVYCVRCHAVGGQGGAVGPALDGIAAKRDRAYLLESIVRPDAQIAEGFETLVVALADGQVVTGVSRGRDSGMVRLVTAEGQALAIPEAEIEEQSRGASAMPADLHQKLSEPELRDLIAYLASLREPRP